MSTSAVGSSGSMINVSGIVAQLMQIEQRPLEMVKSKISSANVSISAMSDLKSSVDSVYSKVAAVEDSLTWSAKAVSVDQSTVLSASVSSANAASIGSVQVSGARLATAQRTVFGNFNPAANNASLGYLGFTDADTALSGFGGSGELKITIPDDSSLLVAADNGVGDEYTFPLNGYTLTEIRDSVNETLAGKVRADLVNAGGSKGWVLVLTGAKIGASATFTASFDTQESHTSATPPVANPQTVQSAQNASATVGGIAVESETNTFENALPGLKFELRTAQASGEVATITVTDNAEKLKSNIKDFASSFSELIKKIRTLSRPKTENASAGPLASNSGVLSLSSGLMSAYGLGIRLNTSGSWADSSGNQIGQTTLDRSGQLYTQFSWALLGLDLGRDGTISVDETKLSNALSGKVGEALAGGFSSNLKTLLGTFRGTTGTVQNVIDSMRSTVSNLQNDQEKVQARIDRLRASYTAKYAALDAKLVSMNQTSSNVRSALAGLSA